MAGTRTRSRGVLWGLGAAVPVAAVVAGIAVAPSQSYTPAELASQRATSTQAVSFCPSPMTAGASDAAASGDQQFAADKPSGTMSYRAVAIEPTSNLLYGSTAVSETTTDEQGQPVRPTMSVLHGDEDVKADVTQGKGEFVTHGMNGVSSNATITSLSPAGAQPVQDATESSFTPSGDFRSLALTRCSDAMTEATFVGMSTQPGSDAVLSFTNPSDRPARVTLTVSTDKGVAPSTAASEVVVAPGASERVPVSSIAPTSPRVAVTAKVEGSALHMSAEAVERSGLTPGGAEFIAPAKAAPSSIIPGVVVDAGRDSEITIFNPSGAPASASVRVMGPQGEVKNAALTVSDIPAGGVKTVPVKRLPAGVYAFSVTSPTSVAPVARSTVQGTDLPGDTVGAPLDFALHTPAEPLVNSSLTSLGLRGAGGSVVLVGSRGSKVTAIGILADGSRTEPVTVSVGENATAQVSAETLKAKPDQLVGLLVIPEESSIVAGAWTQKIVAGTSGPVVSTVPLINNNVRASGLDVRIRQ